MKKVVSIKDLSFSYGHSLVLEEINLEVEEGDFLAVVGPNGGGKTTLLRLMLGYLTPLSGSLSIFDGSPQNAGSLMGYVPQHKEFPWDFPVTVMDVVLMGRIQPGSLFPRYKKEEIQAAKEAMEAVKIGDLAERIFGRLSGGQKQRTLIARALISAPRLLLLDEPTASVDSRVEMDIYELLRSLNKKMTIIIVSHDLGFVSSYVNKVACVNRRLKVHSAQKISSSDINETYDSVMKTLRHECRL